MSSNIILTLKNILVNGESNYKLDDLKQQLGLDNDESLMGFLLDFLNASLEETAPGTMKEDKAVIEIVYNYLNAFIAEDRKYDLNNTIKILYSIKSCVEKKTQGTANTFGKPSIEKEFWHAVSTHNMELIKTIRTSNKYKGEDGDYRLLEDMVYNIKNMYLLQEVSTRFPKLFLENNKDGQSFFSNLISFYIDIMKKEDAKISDIVYYDTVIGLFLDNKNLKIDKKLINSINVTIDQIGHNKKIGKQNTSQRIIFLEHLKKKLMREDKYVENVKELNNKYKCNTVISGEGAEIMSSYLEALPNAYHDFTDKKIITIDPAGALDLDDGFSLEKLSNNNYLLGIYIADVSNCVPFNSIDDVQALYRGSSIYCDNGVVTPMLSRELSADCCSLLPESTRKVIVCFFEIEPDGNIKRHFFSKGIIRTKSNLRLSYVEVDRLLNDNDDSEISRTLCEIERISKLGLLSTLSSEQPFPKNTKYESHLIVGKLMVLINYIAAMDAKKTGIPFLYRTHQLTNPNFIIDCNPSLNTLVEDLEQKNSNSMVKSIIAGSFSKACYSTDPLPHEGLGLEAYAHTSSPIRRYADLANQRLIKLLLINKQREDKKLYEIEGILNEVAEILNNNQFATNQYINDYAHVLRK